MLCVLGEGAGWVLRDLSCAMDGKTRSCSQMVFVDDERGGGFHLLVNSGKERIRLLLDSQKSFLFPDVP